MSLRIKLGTAFIVVLLPLLIVMLGGWWRLNVVLERQRTVFHLSREIEQLFSRVNSEEQLFVATGDLRHSREVIGLFGSLWPRIERFRRFSSGGEALSSETAVLDLFEAFHASFTGFTSQVLELQTFKSRIERESKRLQEEADAVLTGPSPELLAIHREKDRLLYAEKRYFLLGTEAARTEVSAAVGKIGELAETVRRLHGESDAALDAFRIARIASVFEENFLAYIARKGRLDATADQRRVARKAFSVELLAAIDRELEQANHSVSRLQVLLIVSLAIAMLLCLAVTLLISGLIIRPVNQLKKSAREIVDGNLDTSVKIDSADEIGELGEMFNAMTSRLRDVFADNRRYHAHLEELVRERTRNLEREIAERRQVEAALQAGEAQLRLIIEQSPMAIIILDREFRVKSWNRTAETVFGYSREEIVGHSADCIIPEHLRTELEELWQRLYASGTTVLNRNENLTSDGRTILCDWCNTPLVDGEGKVADILCFVENITEREKTEKELLKAKKLESTGVLAGGIAHDFNNILTAILGNISLSLHDAELREQTRMLLQSAEKASIRAKALTQQLLTFARGGEPVRETMSLSEVIRDSASFVLHGSAVTCRYDIPEDLWPVHADKGQISQVVQNIVLNARHAMPGGGVVDIVCRNLPAGSEEHPLLDPGAKHIRISISDSGIGMTPEVLERIFDPYYTTKQEGSGLGLAITQSIINKHGGRVLVTSEPGKGTTFTIFLPVSEGQSAPAAQAAEKAARTEPAGILVMDDEESVLGILQSMLEAAGHRVYLSHDGRECAEVFGFLVKSGQPVDLAIVDLTVRGGVGGREAVALLHAVAPGLPVIVSSGYSNDPVMANCREFGFWEAVSKPYEFEELLRAVNRVLDGTGKSEDLARRSG
jgi:PAS domain S-box-containing protein